jgi:hypothetical protein
MDSFLDFCSKYFLLQIARQARKIKDSKGDSTAREIPSRRKGRVETNAGCWRSPPRFLTTPLRRGNDKVKRAATVQDGKIVLGKRV